MSAADEEALVEDATSALRERDAVRRAVGGVLFHVANFPDRAQPYLLGQNMAPLNEKITAAVLDAVRRPVVPEPNAFAAVLERSSLGTPEAQALRATVSDEKSATLVAEAGRRAEPQGESSDAISIPRPHVPFGPEGVPEHEADADYLDHAATSLEGHYEVGGSNVRATVVKMLRDAAAALRAGAAVTKQGDNNA